MTTTTPVSPKVTASVGGGGAGIAISTILVWLLTSNGVEVPEPVASAIGGLLALGLSAGAAYLRRDPMREEYVARHGAPHDDNLRA